MKKLTTTGETGVKFIDITNSRPVISFTTNPCFYMCWNFWIEFLSVGSEDNMRVERTISTAGAL